MKERAWSVEEKMGLLHVYCGEGKGKTTAALGLAVRAAGRGMKVTIARFLKTEDSGEVTVLRGIPGIYVFPCEKSFGFTFSMSEEERREAGAYYQDLFCRAVEKETDVLILDEILAVCEAGLLDKGQVEEFLLRRLPETEVVMTGRKPWKGLLDRADYVTEMRAVRHPYQRGIAARRGIEY